MQILGWGTAPLGIPSVASQLLQCFWGFKLRIAEYLPGQGPQSSSALLLSNQELSSKQKYGLRCGKGTEMGAGRLWLIPLWQTPQNQTQVHKSFPKGLQSPRIWNILSFSGAFLTPPELCSHISLINPPWANLHLFWHLNILENLVLRVRASIKMFSLIQNLLKILLLFSLWDEHSKNFNFFSHLHYRYL